MNCALSEVSLVGSPLDLISLKDKRIQVPYSCQLKDTNPKLEAEQEAGQPDAMAVSDEKDAEDPNLATLDHKDLPALRWAKAELIVRHKKKNLDLFFRARVTSMIALINLFFDPELDYGWIECSQLAAKAFGKGSVSHVQNLRKWVVAYM